EAKKALFELINSEVAEARTRYNEILEDGAYLDAELKKGAEKARAHAAPMLAKVRSAVGLAKFG
ncbi:MAG: tryptophan--tRNA ligase, partial [Spongiibacter sp.]|nr:tryptophan--tRNA ligase [Spongiibacter sp.]